MERGRCIVKGAGGLDLDTCPGPHYVTGSSDLSFVALFLRASCPASAYVINISSYSLYVFAVSDVRFLLTYFVRLFQFTLALTGADNGYTVGQGRLIRGAWRGLRGPQMARSLFFSISCNSVANGVVLTG